MLSKVACATPHARKRTMWHKQRKQNRAAAEPTLRLAIGLLKGNKDRGANDQGIGTGYVRCHESKQSCLRMWCPKVHIICVDDQEYHSCHPDPKPYLHCKQEEELMTHLIIGAVTINAVACRLYTSSCSHFKTETIRFSTIILCCIGINIVTRMHVQEIK